MVNTGIIRNFTQNFINPLSVLRTLRDEKITILPLMPAVIDRFASIPESRLFELESLRLICSSGGALTKLHLRTLKKLSKNAKLMPMYGFSEAFRSTFLQSDKLDRKPTSVGRPFPTIEIKVFDECGIECQANEIGQIVHFGGCISLGYWGNKNATSEKIKYMNKK